MPDVGFESISSLPELVLFERENDMNQKLIRVLLCLAALFAISSFAQQSPPSQAALDDTIKTYCAAWSEPDAQRRQQLLEKAWATKGTYTDPTAHVEGRKALADHIGAFMQRTPGARIIATSLADSHHGKFRFTWKYLGADGKTISEGVDFGSLDADGRIQEVVGFFGATKSL